MMMNLFSIFEPSTSLIFSLNWLSILFIYLMFPLFWWNLPSRYNFLLNNMIMSMFNDLKSIFKKKNFNILILFLSLFWSILFWNIFGLFPYIFTPTSHLLITLSLSMNFWFIFMIFGYTNYLDSMFSHLIPEGTPEILSVFMVLIETTSNIIRPITLSVRLAANMIAGHLLISLLSDLPEKMNLIFIFILPVMICLLILEIAVAMIQSYVFVTLTSLYLNEIN